MSASIQSPPIGGISNATAVREAVADRNYREPPESPVQTHLRLDDSRRELKELFDPEERTTYDPNFPRSKVMRTLSGNRGLTLLALGAGGFLLAKPKLLMTVVRMIPVGAIARMAAVKLLGGRN
jgi:hypothetical protein